MTPMSLTRKQAVERLRASESEIRALGVERLALFGSVLRGTARPDSDVDLLVQFSRGGKTFDRFLALCELLEERLDFIIDVVLLPALHIFSLQQCVMCQPDACILCRQHGLVALVGQRAVCKWTKGNAASGPTVTQPVQSLRQVPHHRVTI